MVYYPDFLTLEEQRKLFTVCVQRIHWHSESLQIFGQQHDVPRLVAWIGDAGAEYTYSGILHQPSEWLPELIALKAAVEQRAETAFNALLANRYRHGQDSIGWHADNEPELGLKPVVASVSLGATRVFKIRTNASKQVQTLHLASGSLLVMQAGFQSLYQHCLAKTKKTVGERINLTFRQIS